VGTVAPGSQARRRDAAATRAALLEAAVDLFADRGFDRTTVRDIAARAGVNQALLFRYFGSKDELFAAVLAEQSRQLLDTSSAEQLLSRVLRRMLDPESPSDRSSLLYALLRSTGNDSAAQLIRRELGEDYGRVLSSLSDAADAELRADLVLAWLFGIGLVRSVFGKDPLASANGDVVRQYVLRAASTLLEHVDVDDRAT
jgi:AcrR family transcriptional regulator